MFIWQIIAVCVSILTTIYSLICRDSKADLRYHFYLLAESHRSLGEKLHIENVDSLETCKQLTRLYKGLAFNYGPKDRLRNKAGNTSRDHYWEQAQLYFNCHVLKCPERESSKTLINDSSFNYYSLYDQLIAVPHHICVSQVGIFTLSTNPETFVNASMQCQKPNNDTKQCGSLAHIASEKRTTSLARILTEYNEKQEEIKLKSKINLAYVGLHFNRSRGNHFEMFNMDDDSLRCFGYRAWEPGNPKMSSNLRNTSCVALSSHGTWLTVDCKRKLPYFCEVLTRCHDKKDGWKGANQ
ncbi:uncharacterized protein LOC101895417 isoform X2 [Musca domestica]|uniref:Uncharacterized protein LOC101895417 isoform X2 n=1 Tax=Musca domestica TaxID=7370 RepID=A0A9J7IC09_MUSDO|nr:uncharacterized protein LOC101895417 isoform X2 [Musca domestica]